MKKIVIYKMNDSKKESNYTFVIVLTILFIVYIALLLINNDIGETLSSIVLFIIISIIILWIMYIVYSFNNGYYIKDNVIMFKRQFKTYTYSISEIQSIIISNAYICGRGVYPIKQKNLQHKIVISPWCTCLFDHVDEDVLHFNNGKLVTSLDIQYRRLNDYNNYGFVLKKSDVMDLFDMYNGNVYVYKSVLNNYKEEITKLIDRSLIKPTNLIVLDDIY